MGIQYSTQIHVNVGTEYNILKFMNQVEITWHETYLSYPIYCNNLLLKLASSFLTTFYKYT